MGNKIHVNIFEKDVADFPKEIDTVVGILNGINKKHSSKYPGGIFVTFHHYSLAEDAVGSRICIYGVREKTPEDVDSYKESGRKNIRERIENLERQKQAFKREFGEDFLS